MKLDNRFLIKQIEARPALWNRHDEDYCHRRTISNLWTEIAAIHGVHETDTDKVRRFVLEMSHFPEQWRPEHLLRCLMLSECLSEAATRWCHAGDFLFSPSSNPQTPPKLRGGTHYFFLLRLISSSKVKTRWKTLRDTFRQELKKNPQRSHWRYYPDMQFLRGQMKLLPAAQEQEEHSGDLPTVKMEQQDAPNEKDHQDPLALPEEPSTGVVQATTFDDDDDDYDHHFLLSLLPEMRRLQPKQKLLLRIKILELLRKELHD